jgi:dihydrofolate reductase
MIIHMIAGMAPGRVIGINNTLPRNYPQDLKHFREITTGKVVIMGYNTYLSIGKELPNRRNIILSFEPIEGLECYTNIDDMMKKLAEDKVEEIYIM